MATIRAKPTAYLASLLSSLPRGLPTAPTAPSVPLAPVVPPVPLIPPQVPAVPAVDVPALVKRKARRAGRPVAEPLSVRPAVSRTIVLGIDPGLSCTGYAVLAKEGDRVRLLEAGAIRSDDEQPLERRVMEIHQGVAEVIAEFRPESVAAEMLYSNYAHPRTAILMGHARGAVFLAAAQAGLSVTGYTPSRIKKNLTGHGHADKEQVQRAVVAALKLDRPPSPHDVSDAIAAALCHLHFLRS